MKSIPAPTAPRLLALILLGLSGMAGAQTSADAGSPPRSGDTWFERPMVLAYTYGEVGQALELDEKTESKLIPPGSSTRSGRWVSPCPRI
jgi:hypothetical protein